ncbi:MAG: RDD family protein [Arcobacteraceae bacterium]
MAKWREVKQGRIPKKKESSISSSSLKKTSTVSIPLRFKSFLIDTFFITTPILYIVIYLLMGGGEEFSQNRSAGWGLIFLFHFFIISFFWLRKAQTPGMKAYNIKLVSNNEHAPNFIQIFIRYSTTLFAIISIFLLFVPFFRKDKRTFQDIFSNTHIALE